VYALAHHTARCYSVHTLQAYKSRAQVRPARTAQAAEPNPSQRISEGTLVGAPWSITSRGKMKTKQEMLEHLAQRIDGAEWEIERPERINAIRNFDWLATEYGNNVVKLQSLRRLIRQASPKEWREAAKPN